MMNQLDLFAHVGAAYAEARAAPSTIRRFTAWSQSARALTKSTWMPERRSGTLADRGLCGMVEGPNGATVVLFSIK